MTNALPTPTVTISADGTTARMARGKWSQTVPVDQLPKEVAFYRKLAKIGLKQAVCYLPWVDAIIEAQRKGGEG